VSPDGKWLAVGMADGGLVIWCVSKIQAQLAQIGLAWQEDVHPPPRQEPQPFVATTLREQKARVMQYANLGNRLAWGGRVAEAEGAFRTALKVKLDDPLAHGNFPRDQKDIKAIALATSLAHANFGSLLGDLSRYQEAVVEFSKAIELQPEYGPFRAQRGWAYADMGQWDKASADFVKATQCKEPGQDAWYSWVMLYRMIAGMPFEKDQDAWYARAMLYLRDGNVSGYREICSAMLRRAGDGAAWTCALSPKSGGDPARIVSLAENSLTKSSRDYWHVNQLGAALYRAGRFEEAVKCLTEATELNPGPYRTNMLCTWFFLAMAPGRLGHAVEARRWLDRAVQGTEEALKLGAEPPGTDIHPHWNQKITLQLLRREAEERPKSPAALGSIEK
jgi:tetratricopeptide (TPR) repeat protein